MIAPLNTNKPVRYKDSQPTDRTTFLREGNTDLKRRSTPFDEYEDEEGIDLLQQETKPKNRRPKLS